MCGGGDGADVDAQRVEMVDEHMRSFKSDKRVYSKMDILQKTK